MRHTLVKSAIAAYAVLALACSRESQQVTDPNQEILIQGQAAGQHATRSSSAGNLIATAIKETNQVDVVLYPSRLLPESEAAVLRKDLNDVEMQALLRLYPAGVKDQLMIGSMSGKDLRRFITDRSREAYGLDLEVAGLKYHIHYVGGILQFANFATDSGHELKDDTVYRTAISQYFYFSGATFPSYKYRNGISGRIGEVIRGVSARQSLEAFLERHKLYKNRDQNLPLLNERRASVTTAVIGNAGRRAIREIQGRQHRSPLYGQSVMTSGIVTAVANQPWYPGGVDLYIQDPTNDGDDTTSEGLHVHLRDENTRLKLGDEVSVSGVVYEEVVSTGLGRTGLREVSNVEILRREQPLPEPVVLGVSGRPIPHDFISTYRGNLNLKPNLVLTDGIDFWESLEGMRVRIQNPRVVGFRGGLESKEKSGPDKYLDLYVVPDGDVARVNATPPGGVIIDSKQNLFNPQIMMLTSNHLSQAIDTSIVYRVGDLLTGSVEGVLGYQGNIFGGGDYAMAMPLRAKAITDYALKMSGIKTLPLEERAKAAFKSEPANLTVATFNVENLSGNQLERIQTLAEVIEVNLRCPDILSLVEIQDANGPDASNGASAHATLARLISRLKCDGVEYKYLNVDPVLNTEGGQPGGNIRVAFLYNARKLSSVLRPAPTSLTETIVLADGHLNFNPGRVFPNDPTFARTRRSIVAEFEYKGERLFVIGNHFNSKLGDASGWGAQQPAQMRSEDLRQSIADRINTFVEQLMTRSPGASVIVLGDFNAHLGDQSMRVLEGEQLTNLMTYSDAETGPLIAVNDRYTTNYNGNSQAIDYILVNAPLLKRKPQAQILHINSDHMGRISDHDPIVAKFQF